MAREFRSNESYVAEQRTRDMLPQFLRERAFKNVVDHRTSYGKTDSQKLTALDADGKAVSFWVRLCWRRDKTKPRSKTYSAAQLRARIPDGDWVGTLERRMKSEADAGVTHLLLVQRDENEILYAAAIPIDSAVRIWMKQRDISTRLIKQGKMGRRHKNHAMNGSSPTMWLQDDKAPEVASALWEFPGVRNLASIEKIGMHDVFEDDSIDDLPGVDYANIGSDHPEKGNQRTVSGVKRDPRVRKAVRERAGGQCERVGCRESRNFAGFLDVHHILGAEKSDRVWNCVALCPNCHREAHFSPEADEINAELLAFSEQFKNGF